MSVSGKHQGQDQRKLQVRVRKDLGQSHGQSWDQDECQVNVTMSGRLQGQYQLKDKGKVGSSVKMNIRVSVRST